MFDLSHVWYRQSVLIMFDFRVFLVIFSLHRPMWVSFDHTQLNVVIFILFGQVWSLLATCQNVSSYLIVFGSNFFRLLSISFGHFRSILVAFINSCFMFIIVCFNIFGLDLVEFNCFSSRFQSFMVVFYHKKRKCKQTNSRYNTAKNSGLIFWEGSVRVFKRVAPNCFSPEFDSK